MVDLWMIGDETEQSFVRRQSTEPFSLVFSSGYLLPLSQTSFGHISISSSMILTVSMAPKSPWKDLSIDTSHVLKQLIMAKILGRSTGNHYSTIY